MVKLDDLLSKTTRIADQVEALLTGDSNPIPIATPVGRMPSELITAPPHQSYALGMYARTLSYFGAIALLAKKGRTDEALTLGRSLFEDSLRLRILATTDDEVRQVDGVIGWLLDGVTRAIGLYREAKTLGIGDEHEAVIDHLEQERDKMVRYRQRRGSGRKTSNPFSEQQLKKAALGQDRSGGWWLHEVADQMVHGNYFAHRMRHTKRDRHTALIAIRDSNPRALIDVIAFAVESVVVSHQSICTILDLQRIDQLDGLLDDLEQIQEMAAS